MNFVFLRIQRQNLQKGVFPIAVKTNHDNIHTTRKQGNFFDKPLFKH